MTLDEFNQGVITTVANFVADHKNDIPTDITEEELWEMFEQYVRKGGLDTNTIEDPQGGEG